MKLFIGMLGVSMIAVLLTACSQEIPSGSSQDKKVVESVSEDSQSFCTMEYAPVCGFVEVQCITAPCDSVQQTFSNRCHAEIQKAKNIQPGECQ